MQMMAGMPACSVPIVDDAENFREERLVWQGDYTKLFHRATTLRQETAPSQPLKLQVGHAGIVFRRHIILCQFVQTSKSKFEVD